MKLLLDVNVVLDVVLARKPWYREAAELLSVIEAGAAEGILASHTVPTLYYIVSVNQDRSSATAAVSELLALLKIVPAGAEEFRQALALDFTDFENAVQAVSALRAGVDLLVTRNEDDFSDLAIPIEPPGQSWRGFGKPLINAFFSVYPLCTFHAWLPRPSPLISKPTRPYVGGSDAVNRSRT